MGEEVAFLLLRRFALHGRSSFRDPGWCLHHHPGGLLVIPFPGIDRIGEDFAAHPQIDRLIAELVDGIEEVIHETFKDARLSRLAGLAIRVIESRGWRPWLL